MFLVLIKDVVKIYYQKFKIYIDVTELVIIQSKIKIYIDQTELVKELCCICFLHNN